MQPLVLVLQQCPYCLVGGPYLLGSWMVFILTNAGQRFIFDNIFNLEDEEVGAMLSQTLKYLDQRLLHAFKLVTSQLKQQHTDRCTIIK